MKACTKCREVKALDAYHKRAGTYDGRKPRCKACTAIEKKEWYIKNAERLSERSRSNWHLVSEKKSAQKRAARSANLDVAREKDRAKYLANPHVKNAANRRWALANPEAAAVIKKRWVANNMGKHRASRTANKIRRKKLIGSQAISVRYKDEIALYYEMRPDGFHVDHIVPLISEIVCGLHVPWNLTLLPDKENRAKSNYWWPDMPEKEIA